MDKVDDEQPPVEANPQSPEEPPAAKDDGPREEQKKGRLEHLIPDILRRTFYAGLGAVFTTEEGIRKLASDIHLPKEITNYLVQQAAASKDELFRVVAKELRGFLDSLNVSGELQKLLTSLSFEIKTEIRFVPNEGSVAGVRPNMKLGQLAVKRTKEEGSSEKPTEKKDPEQ